MRTFGIWDRRRRNFLVFECFFTAYAEKQQILYVLGHLFCKRCPMIPKKIRLRRANIINNPSPISMLMKATVAFPHGRGLVYGIQLIDV